MTAQPRFALVVDDEPDMCWALERILGRLSIVSGIALDGHKALAVAKRSLPQVALLDAKLPDMDGLVLARKLRAIHPAIWIVLVSGYLYGDDPVVQSALEQGLIQGFIEKPFSHAAITSAMARAFAPPPAHPV